MRIAKNLLFSGLTVLVITLAACDTGWDEPPGLNLPNITEATTGRPSVTGTNIPLRTISRQNLRNAISLENINIPQQNITDHNSIVVANSYFSVTNGKLSFNLGTPASPPPISGLNGVGGINLFYRTDSGYDLTFSPDSVNALMVDGFFHDISPTEMYTIYRAARAGDGVTYSVASGIGYIYVNNDCTISRQAKTWLETYSDGTSCSVDYKAFTLPLKAGWNLIQRDANSTATTETAVLKIADKDVPWIIEKD